MSTQRLVAPAGSAARSGVVVSASLLASSVFGGLLALLLALIVGEGAGTDAFLAAYSLYLVFALFGATLRVALVPLLGSVDDEARFVRRSHDAVARLVTVGIAASIALAAGSPLLGRALVPGASEGAKGTAAASVAILAGAAACQIWAAALAAVLGAGRRFVASALFYVAASAATVALAAGLMVVMGILGAGVGVLGGSLLLLGLHLGRALRLGLRARPRPGLLAERATWTLVARVAAGAALALALQITVAISLAAVSARTGAPTAYSYAYFLAALFSSVTSSALGLVTLPDLVSDLARRGAAAAEDWLGAVVPFAALVYVPLAAAYAVFGRPVLDAVLGGSLSDPSIDVLWDASRVFLAMGLGWLLLFPLSTLALSTDRHRGQALVCIVAVPLHLGLVTAVSGLGPRAVATVHAAGMGAALTAAFLVLVLRARALPAVVAVVRRALPAGLLALVFPLLGLVVAHPGPAGAVALSLAGGALYAGVGVVAWPSVAGRAARLLAARA